MFFDRYTILKWQEKGTNLTSGLWGQVSGLYGACNATAVTRLISLGAVFIVIFLVTGLVSWLRPAPDVPLSKRLVLTAPDAQKNTWSLDYLKHQDIQAILNGPVKPGQPLRLTVKFFLKSPELLMKPDLIGAAGEHYYPGIIKNGQWQSPPSFMLTDRNNQLLHKGQFEYG